MPVVSTIHKCTDITTNMRINLTTSTATVLDKCDILLISKKPKTRPEARNRPDHSLIYFCWTEWRLLLGEFRNKTFCHAKFLFKVIHWSLYLALSSQHITGHVNLLTAAKQPAFSANHLTDGDKTNS